MATAPKTTGWDRLDGIDPTLDRWLRARFPRGMTEAQAKALPAALRGESVLVLAPTGSGKTLCGFLAGVSRLLGAASEGRRPLGASVLYLSPLRALTQDVARNLEPLLAAAPTDLPEGPLRAATWTSDTTQATRKRLQVAPPDVLLTTPESLALLCAHPAADRLLGAIDLVVVDELHALAESKRGAQLATALERLELVRRDGGASHPVQRIGLSATAHPPEAMARFLVGVDRPCTIAQVDLRRTHRLRIVGPPPGRKLPPAGHGPARAAHAVAREVEKARCALVFTGTRSAAERLGLALSVLLPEEGDRIGVHHSSLGKEERALVEDRLAAGEMRAVVASSSLELGLDLDAVDQVLLVGAPKGVSRTLQRIGRAGHRPGGVAEGALVPVSLPDALECAAIRRGAAEGRLEPVHPPREPLDVLAQELVGFALRDTPVEEAFAAVRRAWPFRDLPRERFDATVRYLAGDLPLSTGDDAPGAARIREQAGRLEPASAKTFRQWAMAIGTIFEEARIQVFNGRRWLGEVEESFLADMKAGDRFVLGGKVMQLVSMSGGEALATPASGGTVKLPRWHGSRFPLTPGLAQVLSDLVAAVDAGLEERGEAGGAAALQEAGMPAQLARAVAHFCALQRHASALPSHDRPHVERLVSRRTAQLIFHLHEGRAVNAVLAQVAARRLAGDGSAVGNVDDLGFLLQLDRRVAEDDEAVLRALSPEGIDEDARAAVGDGESLARRFRAVAEVGQLLPRVRGRPGRSQLWSGRALYRALQEHAPDHPLLAEVRRAYLEDELDLEGAVQAAARLSARPMAVIDLPRPSPFAIPIVYSISREVLRAQDPSRALAELSEAALAGWEIPDA